MAFPAIESINPSADSSTGGAATSGSTAATSHSVVMPATVTAGSLLMVFGRVAGTGAVTATGWTVVEDSSDAADDVTFYAYKDALAAGTEDGTSVTFNHGNFKMAAVSVSITGAANPATRTPQASTVAVGTSTTPNPTSVAPTGGAKDYLYLWFGGWDGEQTLSKTQPTNYTDRADVSTGTGGLPATNAQIKVCDRQLNASSEDPGSLTLSGAPTGWAAWTVAVHPPTAQSKTITPATETDTAGHLQQVHTPAAVAETGAAQPLSFVKPIHKTLGVVAETDAAQVLSLTTGGGSQDVTVGVVTETDTAQALDAVKSVSVDPAAESGAAQALIFTKPIVKTLGVAAEADAAQALTQGDGPVEIGPAAETDTARPLNVVKPIYKTLGVASETDTPGHLQQVHSVTPVAETDAAQAVTFEGGGNAVTVTPATETDTAQPLSYAVESPTTVDILPAGELVGPPPFFEHIPSDVAQALTVVKRATLGTVAETDTAQSLAFEGGSTGVTVGPAAETDTALSVTVTKAASFAPVDETDTAQPLVLAKRLAVDPAGGTDTAQPLSVTHVHYRTVGVIAEADVAQALVTSGERIRLGQVETGGEQVSARITGGTQVTARVTGGTQVSAGSTGGTQTTSVTGGTQVSASATGGEQVSASSKGGTQVTSNTGGSVVELV
jgi:hypothetical protein